MSFEGLSGGKRCHRSDGGGLVRSKEIGIRCSRWFRGNVTLVQTGEFVRCSVSAEVVDQYNLLV